MNYQLLDFPVHGDHTGNLVALESGQHLPFDLKRVYYIWGTAKNAVRGKHAHKNLEQVIICLAGECDFILDDGKNRETVHLSIRNQGLYIKHNIWREFTNFTPDCVLMVLASEHYDAADYVRDYTEFLAMGGGTKYMMFSPIPTYLDNNLHLLNGPRDVQRAFYIYGTNGTSRRGCHANLHSRFWMTCVAGSCTVDIKNPDGKTDTFVLDNKSKMLYMDSMVWKEMRDFSPDAVLVVLSDKKFDKNEYIKNWDDFITRTR